MIRPALRLAETHDAYYFVADAHALTTVTDPDELRRLTFEAAAVWLSLGYTGALYRQSDVPEIFELSWILSCVTPKGTLDRAHAYKAARAARQRVTAGLYTYPVLMAADILAMRADVVPVGRDQRQHVETARDVALAFNRTYGDVLTVPEPVIDERVATIPGTDGRKMSKSYGNVIPLFGNLRAAVIRIVTDARGVDEPKDPSSALAQIYAVVASPNELTAFLAGGVGYREAKDRIATVLDDELRAARDRYAKLRANEADRVLAAGAARARAVAAKVLERVRDAAGLGR
jgi:tryptophanyl-tRNA synthetase